MDLLHFGDYVSGDVYDVGVVEVTEAEIIAFGRAFDPQSFHVDPELAKTTVFGGIVASGWHTCAMYMRMYVDALLARSACLGSPGIDQIRFLRPVRPGDVLSGRATVVDSTPGRRAGRGTVRMHCELFDAEGTAVLTMTALTMFATRPA
ncbi:MAG TPA: MaoC family dehydratase [Acidimicrobiales bacterium]|nr:MaoC family dehydratase [Acidimicrobiales bacterium]